MDPSELRRCSLVLIMFPLAEKFLLDMRCSIKESTKTVKLAFEKLSLCASGVSFSTTDFAIKEFSIYSTIYCSHDWNLKDLSML